MRVRVNWISGAEKLLVFGVCTLIGTVGLVGCSEGTEPVATGDGTTAVATTGGETTEGGTTGGETTEGGTTGGETTEGSTTGGETTEGGTTGDMSVTYQFDWEDGTSSISYSGQTLRQVLISDLKTVIGTFDAGLDTGALAPSEGTIVAVLNKYYSPAAEDIAENLMLSTTPVSEQATYDAITSSPKSLSGKVAGNDAKTDHQCWDPASEKAAENVNCDGVTDSAFAGWEGAASPSALVGIYFQAIEDAAIAKYNGTPALDPDGNALPVHVTAGGWDLQQLTQKFLLMSITFSQATDDYMDDDVDGKGLLQTNVPGEGETYSNLAHGWDEAFGYFGAARDYDMYTDEEIAQKGGRDDWQGYHDSDGNESIDFKSEYNFGSSVNAAKRDLGSTDPQTDFTKDAFDGFVAGRALIHGALGTDLDAAQLEELQGYRNAAVAAWEHAIAATVVHYVNDTLGDMAKFGTDDYSFTSHAKHWSELKGFALGLQFNPRSPLTTEDFTAFHAKVGMSPALESATPEAGTAYETALTEARTLLCAAYQFSDANCEGW